MREKLTAITKSSRYTIGVVSNMSHTSSSQQAYHVRHNNPGFCLSLTVVLLIGSTGCERAVPTAPTGTQFKLTATIQDLMVSEVDPSADALWESVATIVTEGKVEELQPRTDAEWAQVRRYAITLTEAGNLLVMPGRRLVAPGKKLEDEGVLGVLTAAESQKAIDSRPAEFVQWGHSLHDAGEQMLAAVDARSIQGMIDAGEQLDAVCEGCHMTFWYPNQVIPQFPEEAPEVGAAVAK